MRILIIHQTWHLKAMQDMTPNLQVTGVKKLINKMGLPAQLETVVVTINKVQQPINRKQQAEALETTVIRSPAPLRRLQGLVITFQRLKLEQLHLAMLQLKQVVAMVKLRLLQQTLEEL